MRHRIHHRKLNRTSEHRKALRRNMAQSLFEHGQIRTTVPKAKDLRPFVERLVTLAVKVRRRRDADDRAGALSAQRIIHKLMDDRSLIPSEHRETYEGMSDAARARTLRMVSGRRYRTGEPKGRLAFTGQSVTFRLIENVAKRYEERPGGYTRVILLPDRRIGDHSQLAILQLVGDEESPGTLSRGAKTSRKKRADGRYALAIKLSKKRGKGESAGSEKSKPAPDAKVDSGDSGEGAESQE